MKESWKVKPADQPPQQFWVDFGKFVNASFVAVGNDDPEHDDYWKTLCHWADVLGKRYADYPVAHYIIMDYVDGQSRRATGRKEI